MRNDAGVVAMTLAGLSLLVWLYIAFRSLRFVRSIANYDTRLRFVLVIVMVITMSFGLLVWGWDLAFGIEEDVAQFMLAMSSTMSIITGVSILTTWPRKYSPIELFREKGGSHE